MPVQNRRSVTNKSRCMPSPLVPTLTVIQDKHSARLDFQGLLRQTDRARRRSSRHFRLRLPWYCVAGNVLSAKGNIYSEQITVRIPNLEPKSNDITGSAFVLWRRDVLKLRPGRGVIGCSTAYFLPHHALYNPNFRSIILGNRSQ